MPTVRKFSKTLEALGFLRASRGFAMAVDHMINAQIYAISIGKSRRFREDQCAQQILEKIRTEPVFAILREKDRLFAFATDESGARWVTNEEFDAGTLLAVGFTDVSGEVDIKNHVPRQMLN